MTLRRVLIANRGEIAVRIARACADHGLASVAVYADPDAGAPHTRIADAAYRLPGTSPAETYMSIPALIDVALRAGADAVHPGYGFLAENAAFAAAVTEAGLTWIGPSAAVIETLGNKVTARELAVSVDAPLAPGSDGPVEDWEAARAFAAEHGLPIAIKAAYGGGGRGMKVVHELEEIEDAFAAAGREAQAAFGRAECFVEKFLARPRHVEAQVLADDHGSTVVIGLRDCSLQRRNQKLVEEAPAPFLTAEQEETIRQAAVRICRAADYRSAGTVEFLIAADGTISFLEVNTRLQVEHPVTEMTTGIDIVGEQLRIAAGLPLSGSAADVAEHGHAIEFRLNAEDVTAGFVPSPGTVTRFEAPSGPGVRVDSGVVSGSRIPGSYDSLMAKLIVHGADRTQALSRARRALAELTIEGVATVVPFHRAVLEDPAFAAAEASNFGVHTTWIDSEFTAEIPRSTALADHAAAAALTRFSVELDGRLVELGLPAELLAGPAAAGEPAAASGTAERPAESTAETAGTAVASPYAGTFVTWKVSDGEQVSAGQTVAVIEAMKMESDVPAPAAGTIVLEELAAGAEVAAGAVLAHVR